MVQCDGAANGDKSVHHNTHHEPRRLRGKKKKKKKKKKKRLHLDQNRLFLCGWLDWIIEPINGLSQTFEGENNLADLIRIDRCPACKERSRVSEMTVAVSQNLHPEQ